MTGSTPWIASAESYNPAGELFTSSGYMTTPRGGGSTATLLNDGRVLIAGGNGLYVPSSFAELYTPASLVAAPALFSLPGPRGEGATLRLMLGSISRLRLVGQDLRFSIRAPFLRNSFSL